MKEIADEEEHVDFMVASELKNLSKSLDGISSSNRVSFVVSDVVVSCYQDLQGYYRISIYSWRKASEVQVGSNLHTVGVAFFVWTESGSRHSCSYIVRGTRSPASVMAIQPAC